MSDKVREVAETAQEKGWFQVAISKLWAFFNSLKLTLFLLITLALVSIIGTVIQQGQPVETYLAEYGEAWTRLILLFRLNDMYHSAWFTALMAMLAVNITVCTFERFPPKWRSILSSGAEFDPSLIERLSSKEVFTVNAEPASFKEKLLDILKRNGYRVKVFSKDNPHSINFYASKGIIGRFGSDVTHISLLIILFGAILGSFYGYRDFRAIYEGESVAIPRADFEIRLDRFWIDYYDTGQIKQYNSLLTVIEDGKEVLTKHIWVNEPLYYKGIRFYQSSYGMAWDRIREAEIALKKEGENELGPTVKVGWGERKEIPGTDYSIKLVGYVADFGFDEATRTVFSKSVEANNPAIKLEVYKGEKLVSTPWIFFNYPGLFSAIPESDYNLILVGFRMIPYSGISMNKDPGTNIVWFGTALMGVGFVLAFFVYHRRIWINLKSTPEGTMVRIGGLINKNQFSFEREFKRLVDAIKAGNREPNRAEGVR